MISPFLFPGCTAVRLTSKEGSPYWLRTCDIGGDIWAEGAHVVSFPSTPEFPHAVLGITHNASHTWLLDGINDAGLTGGLLALWEGTSTDAPPPNREGVMGMELVTVLLSRCATVEEAARQARNISILSIPYRDAYVPCTAHYIFTDVSGKCIVLEAADPAHPGRLHVYSENLGILTNSPPYPQQIENLQWYLSQSPELRHGPNSSAINAIQLNGMTVRANPDAGHISRTGTFPASYAASDRFIRMAMLAWLNREGRDFPDRQMLPLGSNLINTVWEPHNREVYHYTRLSETGIPEGRHESYTQYLVVYDIMQQSLFLRPYDTTAWTRFSLPRCCTVPSIHTWDVCRDPLAGVIDGKTSNRKEPL